MTKSRFGVRPSTVGTSSTGTATWWVIFDRNTPNEDVVSSHSSRRIARETVKTMIPNHNIRFRVRQSSNISGNWTIYDSAKPEGADFVSTYRSRDRARNVARKMNANPPKIDLVRQIEILGADSPALSDSNHKKIDVRQLDEKLYHSDPAPTLGSSNLKTA